MLYQPEFKVDHSPPSGTKANDWWSFTSAPPTHLDGVQKQNFTFT